MKLIQATGDALLNRHLYGPGSISYSCLASIPMKTKCQSLLSLFTYLCGVGEWVSRPMDIKWCWSITCYCLLPANVELPVGIFWPAVLLATYY
jgi:hypothetical protein